MSAWHAKPTAAVQPCCRRIQNSQVLAQSCLVSSCGHTAAVPPAPSWNHCKKQQAWASATERRRLAGNKWKQCGVSLVQGKPFTSLAPPQIINYCNWYYTFHYCPPMHMSTWGELLLRKNQAALDIFRAQDLYAQKPAFDPREAIPFGHSRSLASKSYKYSHCLSAIGRTKL